MAALLHQFVPLSGLLSAAELDPSLSLQFSAACVAIQGCALLSGSLPPEHSGASSLGSALALVFGAGALVLHQPAPTANASEQLMEVGRRLTRQLAAASMVLIRVVNPRQQLEVAAAFFTTAGRPQAVQPWLSAVSQALLRVLADPTSARGGAQITKPGMECTQLHEMAHQCRTLMVHADSLPPLAAFAPQTCKTAAWRAMFRWFTPCWPASPRHTAAHWSRSPP